MIEIPDAIQHGNADTNDASHGDSFCDFRCLHFNFIKCLKSDPCQFFDYKLQIRSKTDNINAQKLTRCDRRKACQQSHLSA
ncbi:hypothetical protein EKN49_19530 [Enterobacter roggenkampii]|nr:hypothetical protein EKN49_19530 [Enterobacter roggenkampii]